MKFKIVNIKTERRIDGYSHIYAESVEENPIAIETKIDSCKLKDKEFIRNGLEKVYKDLLIVNDSNCVKVGDIL